MFSKLIFRFSFQLFAVLAFLFSAQSTYAALGPRTAVVYSDWAQSSGKEIDRPAFKALGWDYDAWENTKLPELVAQLSKYDMLVFTVCYNFTNAQEFGAYAKDWKAFLRRGGIMLIMDFENDPPRGISWIGDSDPRFIVRGGGKPSPFAQKAPEWVASNPLMKSVDDLHLCWSYWDYVSPYYTPLVRDGAWRPQLAMQEVGDGVLVISTLYAQSAFPPSSFLSNLWDFARDPARRKAHSDLNEDLQHAPGAITNIPTLSTRPDLNEDDSGKAWRQGASLRFSPYDGAAAKGDDSGRIGSIGSDVYLLVKSGVTDSARQGNSAGRDEAEGLSKDKIEIYVESSEGAGSPCLRRFVVNSDGALYDEENGNAAWSGWWEAKTRNEGGEWSAAIRLPLLTLVPGLTANTKWKINIARYRAGSQGTAQKADWLIPPYSTSDWPERLGRVRSELKLPAHISGESLEVPVTYDQGRNTVAFRFHNSSSNSLKGELSVTPVGDNQTVEGSVTVNLPEGTTGEIALPVIIEGTRPVRYQAVLRSGEDVLFSSPIFSGPVLESLDAMLAQPSYRGIIQSKDPTKWVEALATVRMDDGSPLELSAIVTAAGTGHVIAKQTTHIEKAGNYTALKYDASKWVAGKYNVKVSLAKWNSKQILNVQNFGFEILPPAPTEITFDDNGTSYVNGKPFFPIGLYNIEQYQLGTAITFGERETMAEVKKHGFNVGITCDGVPSDERMTWADEIGLYLAPTPFNITRQSMNAYATLANRHPSVLYWYGSDEMAGEQIDRSIADYKILREIDPHRPVISAVHNWNPTLAARVHTALDIMMPDFYPIPGSPLTQVADGAELSKQYNGHQRSWVVPQAFAGQDIFARVPTKEEIRCQAYLAITHGAKGLFWYSYGAKLLTLKNAPSGYWFLPDFPDQWSALTSLNAEITALSPAILGGHVITGASATDEIHIRVLDYQGKKYILAVNGTSTPIEARLTFPGVSGKFEVFNEGRVLTAGTAGIGDKFGPLEAHIYVSQ